jgi:glucosylceramidase
MWFAVAAAGARAADGSVEIVQTTSDLTQRMTRLPDLQFATTPSLGGPTIEVDDTVGYQHLRSLGAALTDTSAWLIERERAPVRAAVLQSLFGANGLRLGFVRVPIGASDFTARERPYTYDDVPRGRLDPRLRHFSIVHDRAYILPVLRQIEQIDPQVEYLASPWSPPGWMKSNRRLDNIADRATLRGSAYGPYAQYFVRFMRAYAAAGVRIAAITPQNEPGVGTTYPGLSLNPASEASFIAGHLRPALAAAGLKPQIYAGDAAWADAPYSNAVTSTSALASLSGVAWHCYHGTPDAMAAMQASHAALDQIVDECSPGIAPFPVAEVVISSLRDWASSVALWNLALDQGGGPVQPPNFGCPNCTGLLRIDSRTGQVTPSLAFYQLGQVSAFVAPGAQRIDSGHFVTYQNPQGSLISPGLDDVAFRNPDGSIVLLTYNGTATAIPFTVTWHRESLRYTLPAGAMTTFRW